MTLRFSFTVKQNYKDSWWIARTKRKRVNICYKNAISVAVVRSNNWTCSLAVMFGLVPGRVLSTLRGYSVKHFL